MRFFRPAEPEAVASDADDDGAPEDAFQTPLHTHAWGELAVSYYCVQARAVAPWLTSWCFNRRLDEAHMERIKADLLTQRSPHLMGVIQAVRDQTRALRIINGQHRLRAVADVLRGDLDMSFDMPLVFEIYDVPLASLDDVDADMHVVEDLFRRANHSLNYVPEDDHDLFCRKVVKAMRQDPLLGRGVVDKAAGRVLRPRILAKDMYELLKAHLPRDHGPLDAVLQAVKRTNVDLSMMPNIRLFGRHAPAEAKAKQRARAAELGFFLNLDSKYAPEVWIAALTT